MTHYLLDFKRGTMRAVEAPPGYGPVKISSSADVGFANVSATRPPPLTESELAQLLSLDVWDRLEAAAEDLAAACHDLAEAKPA